MKYINLNFFHLKIGFWKENENNSIEIVNNYDPTMIDTVLKRKLTIITKLVSLFSLKI
jgi:hypothetical protein